MNHEEQKLQMQCVAWFRAQYPQYAMLLTHPINEGNRNTGKTGGIHKAEGTVAGVPDLLFFMPAMFEVLFYGLGIEVKTQTGKQSQQQKDYEKMFRAAGYCYVIIRSFEDFKKKMNWWISHVASGIRRDVAATHVEIEQAARQREKEKFRKFIGKK